MIQDIRSFAFLVIGGSMLAMLTGSADARAASDSPSPATATASREYLLKAAFLYNFAKFTTL